jgi:flagellar export protein FliJ
MFRFRLERVLQHRQREVDACSRDVAAAQRALQEAEQELSWAVRDLARCRAEIAAGRQGRLDAAALQRATAWQDELVGRRTAAEQSVAAARRGLVTAQGKLQQAWRDREMLERLRQRQRQEWEQEQARRERRALDEIGAIRSALAGRRRTEGPETTSPGGE